MAPSTTLPVPPAIVGQEPLHQSNGHALLPSSLKSNLKHKSSLSPSLPDNGSRNHCVRVSSMSVEPATKAKDEEEEEDPDSAHNQAVGNPEKRQCKVQWIDNCGKDLTQILEFEPSDSDDSDDDNDDGQSMQLCACLIQ